MRRWRIAVSRMLVCAGRSVAGKDFVPTLDNVRLGVASGCWDAPHIIEIEEHLK